MKLLPLLTLALLSAHASAAEMFPFVLPWDDATLSITNLSGWLDKPAGAQGFVTTRDGHLYAGEKRLRIFGINLAFGANFPTHGDAEKVAARMAKFGINCVRFHHMDTATAPAGLLQSDRRTLDPTSLEKLDYFIAQLKKNGIYANLNLHVGNPYPGIPSWENSTSYFKGVDNFYPPMIELQHDYARALLTHVNPYTSLAYTADPAVAFIEINNENGLIMEWNNRSLDRMPDPLAAEFSRQWNEWLGKKYGEPAKFAASWGEGAEPLGEELLKPGAAAWLLETHEGAQAERIATEHGVEVKLIKPGPETWHVQLTQGGLTLAGGKTYSIAAQVKASAARTISVSLTQAHAPWKVLASQQVKLAAGETKVEFAFTPAESDTNARLSLSNFGSEPATFAFADLSLRQGGIIALQAGETLGHLPFFRKDAIGRRTLAAQRDWNHFLYDTEAAYWPGMAHFIRQELGAKSLVLGSATGFSPWPVQAMLDVVDAHAYWQHPHFPHRQWDMNDWTEKNIPMSAEADGGTLPGLALRRVAGKPFIVTEYNHASPNTYSSEAFLEVCAMAAAQDWDGIFAFAYCHRTDQWDTRRLTSFFDIDQHPTKMATLPAALALFYRADLRPSCPAHVATTTLDDAIESIRKGSSWVDGRTVGLQRDETFQHPVAMSLGEAPAPAAPASDDPGKITWDATAKRMLIVSPRSAGAVGAMQPGEVIEAGPVKITPGETRQGWATINLTVMEGSNFQHATRWLITATGETGNQDMQWKDATKTSVGTHWGNGPSTVEGIPATLTFPAHGKLKAWALDGQGQHMSEVPVSVTKGAAILTLSPDQKTIWWEVSATK